MEEGPDVGRVGSAESAGDTGKLRLRIEHSQGIAAKPDIVETWTKTRSREYGFYNLWHEREIPGDLLAIYLK
ncbi:hypothetical protein RvY_04568 [Ramazzottius varieornatus]|uniref:Uncharacterized protein n=1 Tax=Ramazzottius varieornatus TaxID=947166 RepID=A0A1D1UXS1_RAMVA|nr:hypothetical protein RvY_04568 [Ramazzottius varieornatus]